MIVTGLVAALDGLRLTRLVVTAATLAALGVGAGIAGPAR